MYRADHPEVAVLLDLERRLAGGRDRLRLDPPPDRVQPADARIAEPREDQLPGDAARDHLVVDDVGRQPGEGQVALPLPNDLVTRREADQVGEPLDRDRVPVADEVAYRVRHRGDLGSHERSIGERRSLNPPLRRRPSRGQPPRHRGACDARPTTSPTASPKIRSAVAISASETVRAGDIRTDRLATLEDEQATLEGGPLDLLRVLGGVELDADHQPATTDVGDEPVEPAP